MQKELTYSQMEVLRLLDQARIQQQPPVSGRLLHGNSIKSLLAAALIEGCPDPSGGFVPHYRITDEGSLALARGSYSSNRKRTAGGNGIQPYQPKAPVKPPAAADAQDDLIEAAEAMRKLASDLAMALIASRMPELKGIADTFARADEAIEKARKGQ